MKPSRRDLARLAVLLPAPAPAPASQAPATEDLLAAARESTRANATQLATFPLPMHIEPCNPFKA